jgi:colanic acid/amylovoran biosynthesis glycosyltransferase
VARLVEIKGHEYVIRAVEKVRQRGHDIHYDIVGDGPLRRKLEALITELKLENVVKIHGSLNSDTIKPLMDQAHVFVLASVSIDGDQEGQGLALQEAQAVGLPVIATNHGALPEGMLPGESGFLVPERDVDALAERLNFLVEHSELWPILGQKGRSFVETRYDIRHLSRQLVQIYERLIAQRSP